MGGKLSLTSAHFNITSLDLISYLDTYTTAGSTKIIICSAWPRLSLNKINNITFTINVMTNEDPYTKIGST